MWLPGAEQDRLLTQSAKPKLGGGPPSFSFATSYFGASDALDGSPAGPCFAVGAALGEPFGLSFPERAPLIPVVAWAPLCIAPPLLAAAPFPTCSEPTALPRGSVLPPCAEASVVPPMSIAAMKQAVRRLFCIICFLSIGLACSLNELARRPFRTMSRGFLTTRPPAFPIQSRWWHCPGAGDNSGHASCRRTSKPAGPGILPNRGPSNGASRASRRLGRADVPRRDRRSGRRLGNRSAGPCLLTTLNDVHEIQMVEVSFRLMGCWVSTRGFASMKPRLRKRQSKKRPYGGDLITKTERPRSANLLQMPRGLMCKLIQRGQEYGGLAGYRGIDPTFAAAPLRSNCWGRPLWTGRASRPPIQAKP